MTATERNYPPPMVPLSPVFSRHSTQFSRGPAAPHCILNCKYKRFLTSGRSAIALALEHAGVGAQDEVLLPAYHCESMVTPAKWLGATPVFYRVRGDTRIDEDDLLAKINPRTRAVIVTHYFGFLQQLDHISARCRELGIPLIEDCAHAFFGALDDGRSVGSWGDYSIASSMKFFPVLDGGVLASNHIEIRNITLEPSPKSFEIKAFVNSIENSVIHGRLGLAGKMVALLVRIKELAWRSLKHLLGRDQASIGSPISSHGGQQLEEAWIRKRASLASKMVIQHSNMQRIVELRQANYRRLHETLGVLPGCRPVHAGLPRYFVPLVFPLYVEEPEELFHKLKLQGVPIWRFGEFLDPAVTSDICSSSVELSRHVLQFPCHQGLKGSEIDWLIERVTAELTRFNRGGADR